VFLGSGDVLLGSGKTPHSIVIPYIHSMPRLPHIYPLGATFFITFRLNDSVPQSILRQLKMEFRQALDLLEQRRLPPIEQENQLVRLRKLIFGKYEVQLDGKPYGDCHMETPEVARIIFDKIKQYDGLYYQLHALSVMPNHVHFLADTSIQLDGDADVDDMPPGYKQVNEWMKLIKGGSAYAINKYVKRRGSLWAKESFDHFVRYDVKGEYDRIRQYILHNPVKAGLPERYTREPYMFDLFGS
jgi:REP element-mobilizing transposase RayT